MTDLNNIADFQRPTLGDFTTYMHVLYVHTPVAILPLYVHTPVAILTQYVHTPVAILTQYVHTPVAILPLYVHTPVAILTQYVHTPVAILTQYVHTPVAILTQYVQHQLQSLHSTSLNVITIIVPNSNSSVNILHIACGIVAVNPGRQQLQMRKCTRDCRQNLSVQLANSLMVDSRMSTTGWIVRTSCKFPHNVPEYQGQDQ
jgi:hypothetical protein